MIDGLMCFAQLQIENKKRNTRENKYIKRKVTYAIDSKAQITISLS